MRVQILDMAEEDLVEGYWFYEMQQPGLGAYFSIASMLIFTR